MTFTNWARNQSCEPTKMVSPSSTQEVASLITRAAEQGERVKAVGTGHSFTATAMTDGVLLSLENLASIHKMDTASGLVAVGAGMRLDELNVRLDEAGLAMPNLGDIAVQTVAGATSTATHGTGTGLGNLATQIVGMEIVAGTGEVLRLDSQNRPDLLRMARVGLGALGVVTEVTLQTVPSFRLKAVEEIGEIDDVTARLEEFLTASDHAEFFWIPGTTACQTKSNNRTEEPLAPQSKAKYFIDKIVGENIAFDVLMRAARRFPSQTERIRSVVVNAGSNRELVDQSYKIFASPRHVRFVEMEYGIPREALGEALERVRRGIDQMDRPPLFPVEVRVRLGMIFHCQRATSGTLVGWPFINTGVWSSNPISGWSRQSWTTTTAGLTGARCTSRARQRWPRDIQSGRRSRRLGRNWTLQGCSATTISTASWDRSAAFRQMTKPSRQDAGRPSGPEQSLRASR